MGTLNEAPYPLSTTHPVVLPVAYKESNDLIYSVTSQSFTSSLPHVVHTKVAFADLLSSFQLPLSSFFSIII